MNVQYNFQVSIDNHYYLFSNLFEYAVTEEMYKYLV